jgi:hypothetical protein
MGLYGKTAADRKGEPQALLSPTSLELLLTGSVRQLSLPTMVSTDRLDNCRGIREDWKQEHMLISLCCINKFYDIRSVQ